MPPAVFDHLKDASANDLKVILYIIQNGAADPAVIRQDLELSRNAVHSALLKWADTGLLRITREEDAPAVRLTSREVLRFSEDHGEIGYLLEHLQTVFGTPFNEKNTVRFASLYIEQGIPVEVILLLATHFYSTRKKGPAYIARMIEDACEKEGIDSLEKADAFVALMEKRASLLDMACRIFSLDPEKVTSSEKTIIYSWDEKLGMSGDMIRAAFSAAGDRAGIRYCNGILKSWSSKGYRKPSDIDESLPASPGRTDRDFEEAKRIIDSRRMAAADSLAQRKKEIYSKLADLSVWDEDINSFSIERAFSRMRHDDAKAAHYERLIADTEQKRSALLEKNGYTLRDLEIRYHCPECSDTGYVNGKVCHCLRDELERIRREKALAK